MEARPFVSILIALVCAELAFGQRLHRSQSSLGEVEEMQNKAEAAKEKLLLEQMMHSFRNAEGVESVFSQLSTVLNKLETRTSTLVSDMSTVKSDLTSVKSTVNSEKSALTSLKSTVATVKSSVNTLKSKQVRCLSGWKNITGSTKVTVTFSPAFSTTPHFMAAFNKLDKIGQKKYLIYSGSNTAFTAKLGGTAAENGGANEFTWIACGH